MKLSDSKTLRVVVSVCVCASCEEMGWPCDKEKSGWYKKLFSLYLHGTVWILKPCFCLNFEAVTAETSIRSETPELHQTGTFSLKNKIKKNEPTKPGWTDKIKAVFTIIKVQLWEKALRNSYPNRTRYFRVCFSHDFSVLEAVFILKKTQNKTNKP